MASMLQEADGSLSTMRILACFVVAVVVLTWGIISVMKGEMQPLSWQDVVTVVGTLFAKAYQRGNESDGGAK
jgi:hypothetical protein